MGTEAVFYFGDPPKLLKNDLPAGYRVFSPRSSAWHLSG